MLLSRSYWILLELPRNSGWRSHFSVHTTRKYRLFQTFAPGATTPPRWDIRTLACYISLFFREWRPTSASAVSICRAGALETVSADTHIEIAFRMNTSTFGRVWWHRCVQPPPKPSEWAPSASCASHQRIASALFYKPLFARLSGFRVE
jgi:hypothetical protein